ncbi:uncharacterized protein MELLADRAFT_71647 [Melampsora larici-populina 98AG31]|uniref:Uncharacterized protein n=1 Tax=Melampsora larici-populina (strain 98AG31 / pathotype 3-4-7) TaxID=747676 RepID=F4RJ10_MELLP|nr:uncharacterized protein MELLADRAFT_71647 [Melampsora larici-populina 98AG31]EGG07737.1 hypothetical protein MELLADRAFT_71647 [Melampsora larici-populina 98AG31]
MVGPGRPGGVQELSLPQPLAREEANTNFGNGRNLGYGSSQPSGPTHPSLHQLSMNYRNAMEPEEGDQPNSAAHDHGFFSPPYLGSKSSNQSNPTKSSLGKINTSFVNRGGIGSGEEGSSRSSSLGGADEFSHLFQDHNIGGRKGVSLADVGAVPDSTGTMRRVDRSTATTNSSSTGTSSQSNLPFTHHHHQPQAANSQTGLPKPPTFSMFR